MTKNRGSRPYRSRTWIVNCTCCHQWVPVPSREVQEICKETGTCPKCIRDDYWMLRIRVIAIQQVLEWIVRKGKKLPESERAPLRDLYARKAKQLDRIQMQLIELQATNEPVMEAA